MFTVGRNIKLLEWNPLKAPPGTSQMTWIKIIGESALRVLHPLTYDEEATRSINSRQPVALESLLSKPVVHEPNILAAKRAFFLQRKEECL